MTTGTDFIDRLHKQLEQWATETGGSWQMQATQDYTGTPPVEVDGERYAAQVATGPMRVTLTLEEPRA